MFQKQTALILVAGAIHSNLGGTYPAALEAAANLIKADDIRLPGFVKLAGEKGSVELSVLYAIIDGEKEAAEEADRLARKMWGEGYKPNGLQRTY